MASCTLPLSLPAPETKEGEEEEEEEEKEKEKPLARHAPVIPPADLSNPEKKTRPTRPPPVPITDEERKKLKYLKKLHRLGVAELQNLQEIRKELQKKRDDLLFRQRCLAARLVDRVIFQRRDATYVRHERRIGLKPGDDLPEELGKARRPLTMALFLYNDMGRALEVGLDKFLVEYADQMEHYKKEVEPEAVSDQNGAPLDSVAAA